MYSSQFDSGFTSSQSTQTQDFGSSKSRSVHPVLPLTVKQISEAFNSNDDKSNLVVDGVDATNVKLLGMVTNKEEKVTNVTFSLDDGTGRMDIIRWMNDTSDTNEMAVINNGMYVTAIGSVKELQGKRQFGAFSVRPVVDYNAVHHHFIQCIHIHLVNTGGKVSNNPQTSLANSAATFDAVKREPTPVSFQSPSNTNTSASGADIYKLVLDIFQEPANVASEHGVHVDEVIKRLRFPANKIKEAIDYHVDAGQIYSTIDDYHFKSTC
ncbi:replication protein A 32 kDa subunit A-like [Iris pallida]|uniref:Replication protein A 32 kDa subunit A-like n=1 Tax=Iris pallida TaxID=29817 RepID=A0AAX6E7A8_IRIPA|nr:replication protein A 32 kDa subunit A-like [Iris pallida]